MSSPPTSILVHAGADDALKCCKPGVSVQRAEAVLDRDGSTPSAGVRDRIACPVHVCTLCLVRIGVITRSHRLNGGYAEGGTKPPQTPLSARPDSRSGRDATSAPPSQASVFACSVACSQAYETLPFLQCPAPLSTLFLFLILHQ